MSKGRWAWVLGCLLCSSTAFAMPFALVRGQAELERGRPRMALMQFNSVLRDQPDHHRARYMAVLALQQLGRCDALMREVEVLRSTKMWLNEVMLAQGRCELDVGAWSLARSLFEEAADRGSLSPDAWIALGHLAILEGDLAAAANAWDVAVTGDRGPPLVALAEAELAVEMQLPDAEAYVLALQAYAFLDEVVVGQRSLEVRLALDEGALVDAEELSRVLVASSFADRDLAALRGEVLRLSGEPTQALAAMSRRTLGMGLNASITQDAIRARIHIDLGDLEEARRLLHGLPSVDPRPVASWWYLARAEGDVEAMERLARVWRSHPVFGRRELQSLVPVVEQESP